MALKTNFIKVNGPDYLTTIMTQGSG